MSTDPSGKTRGLALSAFLLEGIAALGFLVMLLFGDGRTTPIDGFVLWALLLGFLSALGSILIARPHPQRVRVRATGLPERRHLRLDRRIVDLGSPTGIERRRGGDRRAVLTLSGFVAD
jgi:hypothetical protein